MPETKPCTRPGCGGTLTRRPRDSREKWLGLRYCSHECARLARIGSSYESRKRAPAPPKRVEYVMPQDFKSLVGFISEPPTSIADGVKARYLKGALCTY